MTNEQLEPQPRKTTIKDCILRLESVRESTLISYFAQPDQFFIFEDCLVLYDNLNTLKPPEGKIRRLDLFLHSTGGFLEAAYKYVRICREYAEQFSVIVPIMAKSAATAVCLGADEIIMTAISELGPLDPLIQHPLKPQMRVPARSIRDYLEFIQKPLQAGELKIDESTKTILSQSLDPYLIGSYEGALKSAQQITEILLTEYQLRGHPPEKIKDIVKKFTAYFYSHNFVIDKTLARNWGLQVRSAEDNKELIGAIQQLNAIYVRFMEDNNIVKLQGTRDVNRFAKRTQ